MQTQERMPLSKSYQLQNGSTQTLYQYRLHLLGQTHKKVFEYV